CTASPRSRSSSWSRSANSPSAGRPSSGRRSPSLRWEPTMTDDPSTSSGTEQARSGTEQARSGTEQARSGTEQARSGTEPTTVAQQLEAILLIVDEPQSLVSLATAVGAPVPAVRQAIETLVADYDGDGPGPRRGFELREVGGGWRIYVRAEHDALVSEFVNAQAPSRLSQAALETLAVVAYKQPVTRSHVASIRAVNVDSVVRTLLARGLITELFADAETGAINYGTTDALLA